MNISRLAPFNRAIIRINIGITIHNQAFDLDMCRPKIQFPGNIGKPVRSIGAQIAAAHYRHLLGNRLVAGERTAWIHVECVAVYDLFACHSSVDVGEMSLLGFIAVDTPRFCLNMGCLDAQQQQ
ncbi:MAG: hypothetical protein IJ907_02535 [Prevotella sp.]|nr:hypothetical protein [Prevotella sp.]